MSLEKAAEKRPIVLFCYVRKGVKKFVQRKAKKLKCTESLVVDTLLGEVMEKEAKKDARSKTK